MDKSYFLDRVRLKQPNAFKTCNYDIVPDTFTSADKIPIECNIHGLFYQKPHTHLITGGCPTCGALRSSNSRVLTREEFIDKSVRRFGDKFNYRKTIYIGQGKELEITCNVHGDFFTKPEVHYYSKHGCPKCDYEIPRNISKSKLIQKAIEVHKGKYDYSKVNFVNVTNKVEIICPTHGSFWQSLYGHAVNRNTCPKCARLEDRLTMEEFIEKSKVIHGNVYLYDKTLYEKGSLPVIITCKKHGDFNQRAASHLAGNGCKKCHLESTLNTKDYFVSEARKIHGESFDYSRVRYTGNKNKVEIICPTHGSFWQTPNSHISSRMGCRLCQESKGEKAIEIVLKKFNINHIREYRIKPYLYRFDFYLPDFNIYIEFHGHQHYRPVEFFGGAAEFEKTKERDAYKRSLVKLSGGSLITINYLSLKESTVEKELIRKFKGVYRFWLSINKEVMVFKTAFAVCDYFNLPYPQSQPKNIKDFGLITEDVETLF